jgi:acyl carrier protein
LTRNKVSEIAERVTAGDTPDFTDDDILVESGLLDSPGILELTFWIEDQFHITIEDAEITISNLGSVSAISSFVESKAN